MTKMEMFFKQNVVQKENKKVAISDRFVGEEGKAIEWELKAITAQDDSKIREANTAIKELPNRKGQFAPQLNTEKYMAMLLASCVVFPDLADAELQDSYGVKNKPDLLTAMLLPGEYQDLAAEIQKINAFKTMEEKVEEAKN